APPPPSSRGETTLYYSREPIQPPPGAPPLWQPPPPAPARPAPARAARPAPAGVLPAGQFQRAALQRPGEMPGGPEDESLPFTIQLEPPGRERLFRLESEAALQERMRQEERNRPKLERIEFPPEPVLSRERHDPGRRAQLWPRSQEVVEPNYV